MGSATLYHLAKRGQRAIGIEQFEQGHRLGSSHGDSRIIREQYFEHPLYVPLVQRAHVLWRELEAHTYRSLLTTTGGLMIGPENGVVVSGTVRSATEHGLPHEVLSPAEVHRRFPEFSLAPNLVAAWDPSAGVLDADACNAAHIDMGKAKGAEVHFDEQVIEWSADARGVRVTTTRDTYSAKSLLLSAGAWNAALLADLTLPLEIERQVVFWLDPFGDSFDSRRFPIYAHEYTPGDICYGFPRLARGVKASVMHAGELIERPGDVRRDVAEEEIRALRDALRPVLPDLANAPVRASEVCLFTNTPDRDFLIDWHPRHPNVLVSSPCSGHGFKFASALGEVQADLLTTGTSSFDITPFRMARLSA